MRITWLIVGVLAFASIASAQDRKVSVELISNTAAVTPGKPFTVALRFQIQPGWHTYWQNPGDTGAPPKAKWTLPDGYTAGPLLFPVPERINAGSGLIAYGYENEMVLLTTITPPATIEKPLTIAGRISWVVCKDVCIAERQEVSLTLPPGAVTSERADDFKKWEAQQPVRAKQGSSRKVNVVIDKSTPDRGVLSVDLENGEAMVDFFPPASDYLTFEKPDTRRLSNASSAVISFKILPGAHERLLGSVVVVVESGGVKAAIELPCTIDFPQ